jgi:EmrB/QacA subfamily drug resistance transporter
MRADGERADSWRRRSRPSHSGRGAGGSRTLAIALCCLAAFVAFLDTTIVNIAFPQIERAFQASAGLSTLSWVVNGYNVVIAALLVPAGRTADRLGRKRFLILGLLLFGSASGACAAASDPGFLIAMRFLQALGAAVLVPTSLALLLPRFAPDKRLSAVTLWGAASALGAGIGPSLGGALVDVWSWRAVFLVNVPLAALAAALAVRALDEEREPGALPDLFGGVLLAGALGALALGIVKGSEWGWSNARTVGVLVGALALLAIVARRCMSHPEPVIEPRLLGYGTAAPGNVATLLLSVALYATILNNVLFLTTLWHWSVLQAGLAISPAALVTALFARPAGAIAERFGVRRVAIPGTIIYAAGTYAFVWGSGRSPDFLAHWLPGALLTGIGMGLSLPVLVGAVLVGAPLSRLATASGINASVRQVGSVLGVALVVSILASAHGSGGAPSLAGRLLEEHRSAWYVAGDFALSAGVIAALLTHARRLRALAYART